MHTRLRHGLGVCLVGLAACLLGGCPSTRNPEPIRVVVTDNADSAASPSPGDILELAKREGELAWYTSLPEDGARAFLDRFRAKYPFLTTRLVRESTFDIIQGVEKEIEAGRVQADVIHVLDVAVFVNLKREGQLLHYSSPEERAIGATYKDPGNWVALRCVGLCIAYNSRRLKPGEAPRRWTDLLDKRWTGRIALKDAQTAGSAYAQYYFLRETYGTSYWHRMAAQRPRIYKTAEECMDALRAGEVDIVSGAMDYNVFDSSDKDPGIVGVWPEDGVPMMLGPIAVLRAAPHPNAARLFVDFALSREGQEALRDLVGAYSPRDDVPPSGNRPRLRELNLMTPSAGWDEYALKQDLLRAEYTRVFHPGSE